MKKRALTLALCLALCLPSLAAADSTPLLYRVTDQSGHTLYLFGTIHVGTEDMYPLSEAVETAIKNSDAVALELDASAVLTDPALTAAYLTASYYPPEDKASNHLSPETVAAFTAAFPEYPLYALERMRVFNWYSIASLKGLDAAAADLGVDKYLTERFTADGKPLYEVEGLENQLAAISELPDSILEFSIMQCLGISSDINGLLMYFWGKGDQRSLTTLCDPSAEAVPDELADDMALFIDAMYTRRNLLMFEKGKEYLASGETVMLAVGVAHMLTDGGLVRLFTDAGYQVEEIGR